MPSGDSTTEISVALPPPTDGPFEVRLYEPTDAFRSIAEHVAVTRPDGGLIALAGPATDVQSLVDAHMFKATPALHAACQLALSLLGGISPSVDRALEDALALCDVPLRELVVFAQLGGPVPGSHGRFRYLVNGESICSCAAADDQAFEHVASFPAGTGVDATRVVRRRLVDERLFEYSEQASDGTAYEVVELTSHDGPESSENSGAGNP